MAWTADGVARVFPPHFCLTARDIPRGAGERAVWVHINVEGFVLEAFHNTGSGVFLKIVRLLDSFREIHNE